MELAKILEGWRNKLIPPEHLKEQINRVSKERLAICRECDSDSEVAKKKGLKISLVSSLRPDEHCMECGCPIDAKTSCLSCECPLKKWLAVLSDGEEKEIEEIL